MRDAGAPVVVVPRHASAGRGHPIALLRGIWGEILDLDPAVPDGLRAVLDRDPARLLEVPVADRRIAFDVDTPEDLARLLASSDPA